ncbi:NAD(P)-dependent oxidoreductase [Streptomyces sp. ME18-1-4]|uniref:NAD(P)-dependent oxidoreductase n=1 Tax=Streptomyces sp. ME18-1-4 TaxID=3028685 RepID=UPI0029AD89B0|nr:NAD(P)-dependent oxidoreductase [Streptomyces sp. ME18-1-4]MDX3247573.1 NAD(P)-dependent oxidoreductase [Streptomyces sp. ME18-1-4]
MSRPPLRVGFIGLGSQGAPMARRIIAAGHETTLWARRPATLLPFSGSGAKTAASPAELATVSDLVCLCVVDDADVEQVVTGPDGVLAGLRMGGVIAIHSTVHPDTCRRLEASARTCGALLVDAPVSGGGRAAEQGSLVVMAGGDPQVFAYCRPVFTTYGDPVVHLGPTGSGQLAKILNNLLFTAHLGLAADVLGLGTTLGLDRAALSRVLSRGSAASFALDRVADAGGGLDRIAAQAGSLLAKDVRLLAEIADRVGLRDGAVLREAALAALAAMGR